jgi:hypothetical protein
MRRFSKADAFPIWKAFIELGEQKMPAADQLGVYTRPLSFAGFPAASVPVAAWASRSAWQVVAAPWREDPCCAQWRLMANASGERTRCAGVCVVARVPMILTGINDHIRASKARALPWTRKGRPALDPVGRLRRLSNVEVQMNPGPFFIVREPIWPK